MQMSFLISQYDLSGIVLGMKTSPLQSRVTMTDNIVFYISKHVGNMILTVLKEIINV